ncbi:hypothetical protein FKM82_027788 [Ascaphus truei]
MAMRWDFFSALLAFLRLLHVFLPVVSTSNGKYRNSYTPFGGLLRHSCLCKISRGTDELGYLTLLRATVFEQNGVWRDRASMVFCNYLNCCNLL